MNLFKFVTDNINNIIFVFAAFNAILLIFLTIKVVLKNRYFRKFVYNIITEDLPKKIKGNETFNTLKKYLENNKRNYSMDYVLNTLDNSVEEVNLLSAEELKYLQGCFGIRVKDIANIETESLMYLKNLSSVVIESFPLLGILGTVCAITNSLGAQTTLSSKLLNDVLGQFQVALQSTVFGLAFAVVFMLIFSTINTYVEIFYSGKSKYFSIIHKITQTISDIK